MIALTLSPRDRKTLLIGATTIGSLILTTRGIPTWVRWQHRISDEAAVTTAEVAASQRDVRNMTTTVLQRAQLERQFFALAPVFIPGDRLAVASARLISIVNDDARDAGLQVGALQAQLDSSGQNDVTGVTLVRVRGDANGDVDRISHFLAALEGGAPLLSIRELSIMAADARANATTSESLHIAFMIEGLARSDDDGDTNRVSAPESAK